ncbi:MAG: hypothetical protein ACRCXA_08075 [Peptostreptococcaceae bacterium]
MTLNKHKREDSKTKYNRNDKKNPNFKLEQGEELNLSPRLRPSKTGSVAQNTSRPISTHKNHQDH